MTTRFLSPMRGLVALLFLAGCSGSGGGGGSSTAVKPAATTAPVTTAAPRTIAAPVLAPFTGPTARLYVDVDRDGAITAADDQDRDKWSTSRGAVFAYNNDDDGGNHTLDCNDSVLNGPDDARTMTAIRVGQLTSSTATSVTLSYSPVTAPVRIFRLDAAGKATELLSPTVSSATIAVADITKAPVNLLLEGTGPRSRTWDGTVTVTLSVTDTQPSTDTIMLRCAPLIYTDNTRPAVKVYVMQTPDNGPFYTALKSGLAAQSVGLYTVDDATYSDDRWVQDGMQLGYQGYLGANGYTWIDDFNQLERQDPGPGLFTLVPNELLGHNQGMSYGGKGVEEACNYGGNLEVIPPHTANGTTYPFGRLYHGGGTTLINGQPSVRHMNTEEVDLLEGQGVQGPFIEISTEWLAVGHVDEISLVVPDRSASAARPWKILWCSPTLAIQALKDLQNRGLGSLKVFAGKGTEKTVNAILSDTNLMTFNDGVQARQDSNKQILMAACGLSASDFIDMPVYYEISSYGGQDFGISQNPGVQNCIPVTDTLYMPDPVGPVDKGQDVWKTQILAAIAPLGLKITWVDVFNSYHLLMGEAHCGTNVRYTPYDAPWWSK